MVQFDAKACDLPNCVVMILFERCGLWAVEKVLES